MKKIPEIVHINSSYKLPFPVTVITCRTASKSKKSLYELGILVVDEGKEIINRVIRINPQTRTFSLAEEYDNITYEDVKNEPTFDKIWSDIAPYIVGNKNIATHYAEFHLDVLFTMLEKYKIEVPDFKLLDIRHLSILLGDELNDYKFETMARFYGCEKNKWNTATKLVAIYEILYKLYKEDPQAMGNYVLGKISEENKKISVQEEIISPVKQSFNQTNNAGCLVFLIVILLIIYVLSL